MLIARKPWTGRQTVALKYHVQSTMSDHNKCEKYTY